MIQTPDLGLQSHPSPQTACLQTASHPNLILKAHVCAHTHTSLSVIYSVHSVSCLFINIQPSLSIQLLHQHAMCCWELEGAGRLPQGFKPSPPVLCSPSHPSFKTLLHPHSFDDETILHSPPTPVIPSPVFPQDFEHPSIEIYCPILELLCVFPSPHYEFLETMEFLLDGWTSKAEKRPAKFLGDGTIQRY